MQSGYRYIINIVLLLLILVGAALFLWREEAFSSLNNSAGMDSASLPAFRPSTSAKDSLDTSVLDNVKFIALKTNFSKFDFNTICRDVSGQKQANPSSPQLTASQIGATTLCVLGNKNPFPVSLPKEPGPGQAAIKR